MTEKRYKVNTYKTCYCKQKSQISVGGKFYAIMNPIAMILSVALILFVTSVNIDILSKISVFCIFGLSWIIGLYFNYTLTKKEMLKSSHSQSCSRRFGLWEMLYGSLWSDFKIMKTKDDGKRY